MSAAAEGKKQAVFRSGDKEQQKTPFFMVGEAVTAHRSASYDGGRERERERAAMFMIVASGGTEWKWKKNSNDNHD